MTGLERFSVRGLRRLQTILLVVGVTLFPFVLFSDSTFVYGLLSIAFVSLFFGFRHTEQVVARKVKVYQSRQVDNLFALKRECEGLTEEISAIFTKKGYSTRLEENALLKNLSVHLNKSTTVQDYEEMKKLIRKRMVFVLGLQENREGKTEKEKEKKNVHEEVKYMSPMSRYLKTLGLTEGTKDMVVIKKAYKQLIKEYHPDVNKDTKAGSKTVEINLAYAKLKEHIEAS